MLFHFAEQRGGENTNRWMDGWAETWEDVADEEETFHISRDKVLLEDDVFDGLFFSIYLSISRIASE